MVLPGLDSIEQSCPRCCFKTQPFGYDQSLETFWNTLTLVERCVWSYLFSVCSAGVPFNPWPILAKACLQPRQHIMEGWYIWQNSGWRCMTLLITSQLATPKTRSTRQREIDRLWDRMNCAGSAPCRQTPLGIPQIQIAPIRRRIQRPIPRRMAHRTCGRTE